MNRWVWVVAVEEEYSALVKLKVFDNAAAAEAYASEQRREYGGYGYATVFRQTVHSD